MTVVGTVVVLSSGMAKVQI